MTTRSELKLTLILASLALITWGLARWNEERDVIIKISENSPDYFSSGYYKKEMDTEGLPKNELLAENMQHYKADGSTHLAKPLMTLFNSSGTSAPWRIQSESGLMAADGDNLQLIGQTHISREAFKNTKALTVNTSNMRVKLATNYAETDDWGEITSPPNKTSGTGMEVTFVSPIHLKFLSKVKGRYELNN